MKKIFYLKNLDCANCANKMEDKVRKIKGVIDVNISFLQSKLIIDIIDDNFDEIFEKVEKEMKKVERKLVIISE